MTPVANLDRDQPLLSQPAIHDEREDLRTQDWRRAFREAQLVLGFDDAGAALWAASVAGLAIVDETEAPIHWTPKEIERLVGRRGLYMAGGIDETSVRLPSAYANRIHGWMRWWRP